MVILTEGLARAAAWDAGNRHMRKDGRKKWNEDDWNTAAKTLEELLSISKYRKGK